MDHCFAGCFNISARQHFGLSRDTISKMCRYSAPPGYVRSKAPERPKLGPLVPVIDAILEADKTAPPKQRHTAKRIFERLRIERGFAGGYTVVKDYVRIARTRSREVFVPLAHPPGHAQVDFGECVGSWEHRITVTNIRPAESGVSYPRYIAGEWNAPPEDCGGIPGFYALFEAVADPNHPNYAEAKEWLDEYDPKVIDDLPIKYALSRIANRRNAAKGRLANNKQTPSATE
ncbi:MAG: hypothetical protein WA624_22700 [Methylocella sp.]